MLAIRREVTQIVDQISAGGRQTEGEEHRRGGQPCVDVANLVGGDDGHEHQQILAPLIGPHRLQQQAPLAGVIGEDRLDLRLFRRRRHQGQRAYDDSAFRMPPDIEVAAVIAGVGEGLPIQRELDGPALCLAGQIVRAVRGQNRVEDLQVARNLVSDVDIGSRRQNELAPDSASSRRKSSNSSL